MALLEVENLTITYREQSQPAVKRLSFSIETGETLALVGESGSGKTTTGYALLGLLPAEANITADRFCFEGQDLRYLSEDGLRNLRGGRIGMVFQDALSALNPLMTVGSQIAEAVRLHHRVGRKEAKARALALLHKVRIPLAEQRYASYPHQLSGGMRQRVVIAMALAGNPVLLIADEPTTALDVTIQAQIIRLLVALQQETGTAILLITHDLGVVAELADRVAILRNGECLETQPAGLLYHQPQHAYTRQLMNARPLAEGKL
ncbi:ATP-binding cassette domain-containing protein [Raoultella sp. C349492]|uniref:ATP-binding cassette domain-containing protein n=1 Tax=Klebsiella/Raoultella group TaxID=2890311 RepID=UPI0035C73D33